MLSNLLNYCFFLFNDPTTTDIYTLSLHDALPISGDGRDRRQSDPDAIPRRHLGRCRPRQAAGLGARRPARRHWLLRRSEEHMSELQSLTNLVCRLLLEKKKNKSNLIHPITLHTNI